MIDDKEIWNLSTKSHSLKGFIQEVLDKTFPKDRIKREINEDGDKLNIACPYCKDSNKKKSKKRGNIYLSTNTFKCFNDGCMTYAPLTKFISYHCQKFNLSPPDIFLKGDIKETIISKKKSSLLNFLLNKEISNKLISLDYFINRFSLSKIDDFSINSQTVNYIKNERFLNGNHKLLSCCYHDEKMEKLYIFNKDDASNKILGFSIRNATEDYYGPKYRIYNYTEILREGLANVEFTKIELREIDLLNNYFNILNLNHREPITILEGQFDSMFIKNAMASTGVGKIRDVLLMLNNADNIKILLDNDKAGKSESLNLIKEGYMVFLWSKFISDLSKKYPSSIKEIKKINDVNDVFKFMKMQDNNITYKAFNNYLDDYYSNSFFDAIFI